MLIAGLAIVGWIAAYLALREVLERKCEENRHEFRDEVNLLHMKMRLCNYAVAEGRAAGPEPPTAPSPEASIQEARRAEPIAWPVPASNLADSEPVSPEIMAVLTETVTGLLGKRVGIRSARKLSTMPTPAPAASDNAEPWSQQGRVLVQSSHQSIHDRASGTAQPAPTSVGGERGRP